MTAFTAGTRLLGTSLDLGPESSKRGTAVPVLDIAPDEGAQDTARAFPVLTREILEVAFEVLFDSER
jgi:hypothetical protein